MNEFDLDVELKDLTVDSVKQMTVEELFHWGGILAKIQQAKEIRKILINHLEIRDSGKIIR